MKKIEMVEKITYFCDICGFEMTNEYRATCQICGREHCRVCHETVKGIKDLLIGICLICNNTYDEFKVEIDDCYFKYDALYKHDANEIFDKWKKESLLINNKSD